MENSIEPEIPRMKLEIRDSSCSIQADVGLAVSGV